MLGANQLTEVLIGAEAASSETLTSFGTAIGWARPSRGRSALEALGTRRFHGRTVGGVVVVAVPPIVIGLPLTVPVCCWPTATAATAPMATKPLAIAPAMSNLTRWCLIDSTVTPPIGPRRSPKRDVSFDVLDQDT